MGRAPPSPDPGHIVLFSKFPANGLDADPSGDAQLLTAPQQIAWMLAAIAQDRQRVSLLCRGAALALPSRIMAVDTGAGRLLLKQPWQLAPAEQVCEGARFNLSAVYQGRPVLLSSVLRGDARAQAELCYAADLPACALWVDLRAALRVRPWPPDPATVSLTLPRLRAFAVALHDVSEGGFSFLVDERVNHLELVQSLRTDIAARLTLPGGGPLPVTVRLRSMRGNGERLQLGFEILAPARALRLLLRRYVRRCGASSL